MKSKREYLPFTYTSLILTWLKSILYEYDIAY